MTPPLTQNLKAVGLWVFFLIYCLTFSFLLNVGLRLALGFLTISLSSESPHHMSQSPSGRCEPSALIPLFVFMMPLVVVVGRIRGGITGKISQEGEMGQTYIGE